MGDTLHLPGRYVTVTRLNPATTEETIAHGAREVFSGSWSQTFGADELVEATPRALAQVAEVEANAVRLAAEHQLMDETRAQIGQLLAQPSGNSCQTGSCHDRATAVIQACGAVYVCDRHHTQISELASMYADDTAVSRG